jgi:hypothetical protein
MEQIRSPLAARRLGGEAKSVIIHADAGWVDGLRDAKFDFFTKLVALLTRRGLPTRVVEAGGAASRILKDDDNIHIMVGDTPGYGRAVLHAKPSYIWGFWYLDEVGTHCHSSLRFARFAPESIDAEKAAYFFNGVSGHMLRENVSKLPQNARENEPIEPAAAVIYCQEIEGFRDRVHYLDTETMIRTCAEGDRGARVYVKLHPNQSKPARRHIMAICGDYQNVKISDASIHDLNGAARVVVTQNSAAGFEALMQKKPVITCAKSDYWHATLSARTAADLSEALDLGAQAMADFDYDKYLYWFLDRNCLEPQKDVFGKRAWARIKDKAFL